MKNMVAKFRLCCCSVHEMHIYVLIFLCNLSLLASSRVNYCGSKMCQHTDTHTFCRFPEGPGPHCLGYIEAPLSDEEQYRVTYRLNQRRAAAASGRLGVFPTAGDMLKLMWIDELAREAQLWADQCEPPRAPEAKDECRDLYSVTVGQSVASVVGEAPGLKPETMVDMWYMQSRHYKGNITSYDPPPNSYSGYYADFAQLVFAKTYMVGCGRSRFMMPLNGRMRSIERFVCNFAPRGPTAGRPLWTVANPATACPPRSLPDDTLPALCAVQRDLDELHDQDQILPLEEHILLDTLFEVQKNKTLNYVGSIDELFLTKTAIARIIDPVTTATDFQTLKNRYIVDDDSINHTADHIDSSTTKKENLSSIAVMTPVTALKLPKEKVSLVGRPKSYNIEELNDDNDHDKDSINENFYLQIQDLPSRDKHFDVDYEFVENSAEKFLRTGRGFITTTNAAMNYEIKNQTQEFNEITTRALTQGTSTSTASLTTGLTQMSVKKDFIQAINNSLTENITDALLDEYLSDPETMRQLQEELERMERSTSTGLPAQRPEKVRRDLRGHPVEGTNNFDSGIVQNTSKFAEASPLENNSTLEQTPMLNMMMRYLPYLKDYKKGILSSMNTSHRKEIRSLFPLAVSILLTILI